MNLPPEFIKYLQDEIKHFDKELISILELPDVSRLRNRIKADRRDIEIMLALYARINATNKAIRAVKDDIRGCIAEARRLTGYGLQKAKRKYEHRDTSYDLSQA